MTIPSLFAATVARCAEEPALAEIEGDKLRWQTWRQLADTVDRWAADLSARGVRPGDRVAQLSANCVGWILTDLAIMHAGAVHVPLHVSLSPAQIAEQIAHSGAKLVVAGAWASLSETHSAVRHGGLPHAVLHSELAATSGRANPHGSLLPAPDDLATILYTSGTTGSPRGVMLTQRNLATNAVAMADAIASDAMERRLLALPLSHIYARTCDLYCWIYHGTQLVLAESRETVLRDCKLAQPTVINAVPYLYQKIADGLRAAHGQVDAHALRAALGGSMRRCFCGGAALAPEVERFFEERGLPIYCGYGLTEAAPVITATVQENYAPGTVGRPLDGVEVRLAGDGEVLARGPNIMRGYWENPADTAAAVRDGWLHTGDLGAWTATGNLRIVGRKKEMLVLATGKKVAPTQIEQLLLGSSWIEQCCVFGDGRKCLGALIVPKAGAPRDASSYRAEIDRCLANAADFEQIGCYTLIGRVFSIDEGELTPKLSLRRKVIEQHFAREIESMYADTPGPRTARLAESK